MPKQLKRLTVHEVSGVDRAANNRTFLVTKAADAARGADMKQNENAVVSLFKAAMAALGVSTEEAPMQKGADPGAARMALSDAIVKMEEAEEGGDEEETEKAAKSLVKAAQDLLKSEGVLASAGLTAADMVKAFGKDDKKPAGKKPSGAPKQTEPPSGGKDDDKPDEDEEDDMSKEQLAKLEKTQESLQADLRKAQDDLKAEQELRKDAEFLTKAREIGAVPGSTFEQTAALLKSVSGQEELAKQTEAMLKAAAEQAKQSELLKEKGTSGSQGGGSQNATSVFMQKAKDLVDKSEGKLNLSQAMEKVAEIEPQAYVDHVTKQRNGR